MRQAQNSTILVVEFQTPRGSHAGHDCFQTRARAWSPPSPFHSLERIHYCCEHIYMDKQYLHGVVTLYALQLHPDAAATACVLKVLDLHALL